MRALLCGDGRRETEGWHGAGGGLVSIGNGGGGVETSGSPVKRKAGGVEQDEYTKKREGGGIGKRTGKGKML